MLLLPGYQLRQGSGLERALLVKFMQLTYQELFPDQTDFSHLAGTVEQYLSRNTPLWLVEVLGNGQPFASTTVGCLWMGNAVDQVQGDRHAHIFLLYVMPEHRRRGIGSALMRLGEDWAKARGDRQMGLQVFVTNQPALSLYQHLGFETQSIWMVKQLRSQPPD
ncbi:MAG TPA: N-acetyltransferase [Candidatus Obscuribacterales bacterium]